MDKIEPFEIRPVENKDRPLLRRFMVKHWGDEKIVAHGEVFYPAELDGYLAYQGSDLVGVVTYRIENQACEVTSLDSLIEGKGIGAALLEAVTNACMRAGCPRLWLVTTNDNLNALRFYQKHGLRIVAVDPGAVDLSRQLKPQIPLQGNYGIPIRDEIFLEKKIDF